MALDVMKLLQRGVILDACSVYSLYATEKFDEILAWIPGQVYLASYVETVEVKQLYNPTTGQSDIQIDLSDAKQAGLLVITKPAPGAEANDAVNFASAMSTKRPGKNTGEAITGAITKTRNWTMVTDDVDATTFLMKQGLTNSLTTTLHVIECWANANGLSSNEVHEALERIFLHARYKPPANHPLFSWWQTFKITT